MEYQTIRFELQQGVGVLTFNRPDKLNALNHQVFEDLTAVLDEVENSPDVRVMVLTGEGRAFVAGADIREFLELDPERAREFCEHAQGVFTRLERLPIPVIACVNGFALGGGSEIAMACDFIYAADTAKFGQPEINLGLIPCFGGTQRLSRRVGIGLAKELCITGRLIEASEAKEIGLAARVFPADELMTETMNAARALAEKGRVALATVKQVIGDGFDRDLEHGLELEAEGMARCFASPDAKEGASAFLEKRKPRFE